MTKETNIRFKVDMVVDGKKQAVELGMALGDLENVMKRVRAEGVFITTAISHHY